jgi:N-methylhydantoinase B
MSHPDATGLFHYRVTKQAHETARDADPIATEIIRNSLNSVAEQMMRAFVRTAFSPAIYEMNDFAIAIYDPAIQLMAQANSLPGFMGTLNFCVEEAVRAVGGEGALEPGDIIVYNVPYGTGSHAQDASLVVPAFHDGKLIGYIANKAHWADIGAKEPYCTDTTDVFQEGVVLPGVKLYSRGQRNADIHRIIMSNSRAPWALEGDLNAQATSALLGVQLLKQLVERQGPELFWRSVAHMYDHGEALMRKFIESIPDGRYTGTGHLDDNGLDDRMVSFEITVEVAGSRVILDFSKVPDAQAGPINCPLPGTVSGCRVAMVMLAGTDMLPNEGLFRPIEVITRPGSMFHPVSPQPCFLAGWPLGAAMEAINEALSQAAEDLTPSGGVADLAGVLFYGGGGADREMWFAGTSLPVGQGAYKGGDGGTLFLPALAFSTLVPMEVEEAKRPIVYEAMEFRPDSGGAGQWRGGMGLRRQVKCLEDCSIISAVEQTKNPAWGQRGGRPGATNRLTIIEPSGERRILGKGTGIRLAKGTVVCIEAGGGGGYGHPSDRDREDVLRDLREGYVTEEHARAQYPHAFS